MPAWVSLATAGGLQEVLGAEGADGGSDAKEGPAPQGGSHEKQRRKGGLVLPVTVPATSISFRPNDSTTYVLGTVAGDLLMVSWGTAPCFAGCMRRFLSPSSSLCHFSHSTLGQKRISFISLFSIGFACLIKLSMFIILLMRFMFVIWQCTLCLCCE